MFPSRDSDTWAPAESAPPPTPDLAAPVPVEPRAGNRVSALVRELVKGAALMGLGFGGLAATGLAFASTRCAGATSSARVRREAFAAELVRVAAERDAADLRRDADALATEAPPQ